MPQIRQIRDLWITNETFKICHVKRIDVYY